MDSDNDSSSPNLAIAPIARSIFLSFPRDWDEWIFHISDIAIAEKVWKYMNPDLTEQPVEPTEPAQPTLQPSTDNAAQNEQALRYFAAENTVYNTAKRGYDKWERSMNKMKLLISQTTNVQYHTYFRQPTATTLWQRLRALKSHLQLSDKGREVQVEAAYEKARRPNKRMTVDTWLNEFRKAYNDAHRLSLSIVDKDKAIHHFLSAAEIWEPSWASTNETLLLNATSDDKKPSLLDLIESFTKKRSLEVAKQALAKVVGARTATALSASTTSASFASFNGKPDRQSECLCHATHLWRKCPYLNDKVREPNWTPDKAIMDEITEKRNNNQRLESAIQTSLKRAADWRARNGDSSAKKQKPWHSRLKRAGGTNHTTTEKVVDDALAFAVARAHSATSIESFKKHWILDSRSDIHITNDRNALDNITTDGCGKVIAGTTTYAITARGTAAIAVLTPTGPSIMTLSHVAYIPHFMTNIVSLSALIERGVDWSTKAGHLTKNDRPIAVVNRIGGHWIVAKHHARDESTVVDSDDEDTGTRAMLSMLLNHGCPSCQTEAESSFAVSSEANLALLWHARLGHPGNEAMSRLYRAVNDVPKLFLIPGICETCKLSKATKIVSRRVDREIPEVHPFHRVSCDWVPLDPGYNGDEYIVHFQCFMTSFSIVLTEPARRGAVRVLQLFLALVLRQYGREVRIIRLDGETAFGDEVTEFLRFKGIKIEKSAPYTQEQNGHAERAGRSIVTKARAIRVDSHLPHDLWPELVKTAAYLMNRTPTKKLGWKTPWEALTGDRPTLKHLKAIGSKCYFLKHNIAKLSKLNARSAIGYLVGYQSRNIWRIWHPQKGKVIRHRDVHFDEGSKFDPDDLHDLVDLDSYEAVAEAVDLGPWNDGIEWSEPTGVDDETEEAGSDGVFDTINVAPSQRGNLADDRHALLPAAPTAPSDY
jgi:hypothetical protein